MFVNLKGLWLLFCAVANELWNQDIWHCGSEHRQMVTVEEICNNSAPRLAKNKVIRHLRYLVCIILQFLKLSVCHYSYRLIFVCNFILCVKSVTTSKHPASNWQVFVVVLTWNKTVYNNQVYSISFVAAFVVLRFVTNRFILIVSNLESKTNDIDNMDSGAVWSPIYRYMRMYILLKTVWFGSKCAISTNQFHLQ